MSNLRNHLPRTLFAAIVAIALSASPAALAAASDAHVHAHDAHPHRRQIHRRRVRHSRHTHRLRSAELRPAGKPTRSEHPHISPQLVVVSANPSSSAASIASLLATPCQNTELTPAEDNLEAIDAATLCLVNQERGRHGEPPLAANAQLEQAAQGHSEEMASEDYFGHVAPSGLTPTARVEATGYIPNPQVGYTLGENIAWATLQLSTPRAIVAAWIASPEHLANILYAPYRDTAVGVVATVPASLGNGQPGAIYSQEFGVIVE